jgi:hypothetical protein
MTECQQPQMGIEGKEQGKLCAGMVAGFLCGGAGCRQYKKGRAVTKDDLKNYILMLSSKVDFVPFCHSVLDTESSEFSHLWIPAFAGMTVFGLLTKASYPGCEKEKYRFG